MRHNNTRRRSDSRRRCGRGPVPLGFEEVAPGTIRAVLVITDERFLDHDTGSRHPERPDRLRAALAGVTAVVTGLCYSSADYGDLVRRLVPLAPRTVAVLEGGYDLEATRASSYAVAGALLGLDLRSEPASGAGPGMEIVRAAARLATSDGMQ